LSREPNGRPELIQRPDLVHRVQQFLGLREASVLPHLSREVHAVIVMGDVREVADEKVLVRPCAGFAEQDDIPVNNHFAASLENPAGSGVVLRVESVECNLAGALVTLQPTPTVLTSQSQDLGFRNRQDSTSRPAAVINQDFMIGGYPGSRQYVLDFRPTAGGGVGGGLSVGADLAAWTIFPGFELRCDSLRTTAVAVGTFIRFMFLWTEATLRSS
jgi:hypothetical protein